MKSFIGPLALLSSLFSIASFAKASSEISGMLSPRTADFIRVTFPSNDFTIVGNLFLPSACSASNPGPAIVVSHPTFGVKEQTASDYARNLTAAGFITLVFDAAYQGESSGLPRGLENPAQRAEDIRAAVSYLTTRDEVDDKRIGALGICASGGYVSLAAQTDTRISVVGTVSAVDFPSSMREGIPHGTLSRDVLEDQLKAANAARTAEANGADVEMVDVVPRTLSANASQPEREVWDYYRTPRGANPRATLQWPVRSLDLVVNYDTFRLNDLIAPRPLLMVVGEIAHTRADSERGYNSAEQPKELFIVDGLSHYDLYDNLTVSGPKLVEYFTRELVK